MRPPCIGDGETEARAALGLGHRAVDLVELLEDPILLVKRYTGPGVCDRDGEMAVARASGDAHFAGVGELDDVPNKVEQNLREALFVAHLRLERWGPFDKLIKENQRIQTNRDPGCHMYGDLGEGLGTEPRQGNSLVDARPQTGAPDDKRKWDSQPTGRTRVGA